MQEEVENRTVNLAISTTKLTGRTLVSAFNAWKRHRAVAKTAKEKAAEAKEAEAAKWLNKDELYNVDWLPADVTLVKKIENKMHNKDLVKMVLR